MSSKGSIPEGPAALKRGEDGGSQLNEISDSPKLSIEPRGRLWAHGLVEAEGLLRMHVSRLVTSRSRALDGRESVDYLRTPMGLDVMDGFYKPETW